MNDEATSSALLEQLVYIDNYINGQSNTDSSIATPNIDVDGQLSLDLAAFADDSFVFPDEEKPKNFFFDDEEDEENGGGRDGGLDGKRETKEAGGKKTGDAKSLRNKDKKQLKRDIDHLSGWNVSDFAGANTNNNGSNNNGNSNNHSTIPMNNVGSSSIHGKSKFNGNSDFFIKQEPEMEPFVQQQQQQQQQLHQQLHLQLHPHLQHFHHGQHPQLQTHLLPQFQGVDDHVQPSLALPPDNINNNNIEHGYSQGAEEDGHNILNLRELPKFPVPPGAKSSLVSAGLSQNQIDLLSALVAQHQASMGKRIPPREQQLQQLQHQLQHQQHQQQQQQQQQHGPQAANIDPTLQGEFVADTAATSATAAIANGSFSQPQQQQQQQQLLSNSYIAPITPNVSVLPAEIPANSNNQVNSILQLSQPNVSQFLQSQSNLQQSTNPRPHNHRQNSLALIPDTIVANSNMGHLSNTALASRLSIASTSSNLSSPDAAELDKKRRNTAASARFRIKKKIKEQQMENKISSLQGLIDQLETKLNNLEMENKLLRNLIIEKGSQKGDDEVKLVKEKAKLNQ